MLEKNLLAKFASWTSENRPGVPLKYLQEQSIIQPVELTLCSLCLIEVLFLIYSIYFLQSVPALSFNSLGTLDHFWIT